MTGKNTLGFLLEDATFYIHTSNTHEVAHFGTSGSNANIRIYTDNQSNAGYVITTQRESSDLYPSFAIQGAHRSSPSFYVQGDTGYLGINTNMPLAAFDIHGDVLLDGQLIQSGTNQVLSTNILQSTTLYTNAIYSCNVERVIDMTTSTLSNLDNTITKDLIVAGGSITHHMGEMQRKEVASGQYVITSSGTHELGYDISWDGVGFFTELDIFEVSGVCYGVGNNTRLHHRFHCMVNPTNSIAQNLPGLDVIAEQNSMSGPGITMQPKVYVARISSNSVRVTSRWTSSTTSYRVSMKLDVFAPNGLGKLTCTPYIL